MLLAFPGWSVSYAGVSPAMKNCSCLEGAWRCFSTACRILDEGNDGRESRLTFWRQTLNPGPQVSVGGEGLQELGMFCDLVFFIVCRVPLKHVVCIT